MGCREEAGLERNCSRKGDHGEKLQSKAGLQGGGSGCREGAGLRGERAGLQKGRVVSGQDVACEKGLQDEVGRSRVEHRLGYQGRRRAEWLGRAKPEPYAEKEMCGLT